jgi:hypothetical protein
MVMRPVVNRELHRRLGRVDEPFHPGSFKNFDLAGKEFQRCPGVLFSVVNGVLA